MTNDQIREFLANSPVAARATASARVVLRSSRTTVSNLTRSFKDGEVAFAGPALCQLEVGGQVLASGEIVDRDGSFCFVATEVKE